MQDQHWDSIWINATLATCNTGYGLINDAALAVKEGKIVWIGQMKALQDQPESLATRVYDVKHRCITPGFIDCHTHLVFAGNRAHEFEARLQGATYEDIARQGGGIQSTVAATRAASEDELFAQSLKRARALLASGVTTVEIKSGYGLDLETEVKMLRVATRIAEVLPLTVKRTFLGAHTIPIEYKDHADGYVDYLCETMIPKIAKEKLADAVDVYCEKIAFNLAQTERVFKAAMEHGMQIKCHAEQLSDMGGAALSARYRALSVDHLEHLSPAGVKAIAQSGTVAVLLPGAYYFLREAQLPPIDLLRKHDVSIAIATDCNPGTSPVTSLVLMLNMACTIFRLTPQEALLGVTRHAAMALGMEQTHGTLTVGKVADMAIWDVAHPAELSYYIDGQLSRRHWEELSFIPQPSLSQSPHFPLAHFDVRLLSRFSRL